MGFFLQESGCDPSRKFSVTCFLQHLITELETKVDCGCVLSASCAAYERFRRRSLLPDSRVICLCEKHFYPPPHKKTTLEIQLWVVMVGSAAQTLAAFTHSEVAPETHTPSNLCPEISRLNKRRRFDLRFQRKTYDVYHDAFQKNVSKRAAG